MAFISSFFAARSLPKRLGALASSTESWAKGDFSIPIQDNSQDEIGQPARQVQLELTGLIHEVRPVNLRKKRFVVAVRDYLSSWAARTKIETAIVAIDDLSIPIGIEQELIRVLQEALSNVARHSQTKTVAISIRAMDNELLLTSQDDGQGFDLH